MLRKNDIYKSSIENHVFPDFEREEIYSLKKPNNYAIKLYKVSCKSIRRKEK